MPEFISYVVAEKAENGLGLTGQFVAVLELATPIEDPKANPPVFTTHILASEGELCLMECFAASVEGKQDDLPLLQRAIADVRALTRRHASAQP